jgi:hypothetical protein
VYGVFTRALREAERRRVDAYSVCEKQGLVPDLQLDDSHYELKSIRVAQRRGLEDNSIYFFGAYFMAL